MPANSPTQEGGAELISGVSSSDRMRPGRLDRRGCAPRRSGEKIDQRHGGAFGSVGVEGAEATALVGSDLDESTANSPIDDVLERRAGSRVDGLRPAIRPWHGAVDVPAALASASGNRSPPHASAPRVPSPRRRRHRTPASAAGGRHAPLASSLTSRRDLRQESSPSRLRPTRRAPRLYRSPRLEAASRCRRRRP